MAGGLTEAVEARGRADWLTTGGSTAPGIYRRLADTALRDEVPWAKVHAWWGDDRYVPRDHPLSNVRPFDDILLSLAQTESGQLGLATIGAPGPVPIPYDQVHPFPTSVAIGDAHGAAWCADQIADDLRRDGPDLEDGWPVFDVALLGVGPDGHVLSVFPGSAALASADLALAIPAPAHVEPHVERVTLNPAVIGVARRIVVVATGAAKAAVLAHVFGQERDPSRWPAQFARRQGATWILDSAAASELKH